MSLRVLFANDDAGILAGLRASLRRHRRQWDMDFVDGARAAELVERERFDVVVTELLFEGVDGLGILRRLSEVQPSAVRVVLSASANQREAMRAAQIAHQYLSMPCEPRELIHRIERSDRLRALFRQDHIAALGALDQLPSPPALYQELRDTLSDPESTIRDVSRIVQRDPGITAKLLQLVNSAFFSRVRKVSDVDGAVAVLGLDLLQGLVLQQGLLAGATVAVRGLSVERESQHGLIAALVARHIASPANASPAFTAALLHDVGKLLLARRYGADYGDMLVTSGPAEEGLDELEHARFGLTHAQAGAYVLGVWGLPDTVVEAVAFHHRPLEVERLDLDVVSLVHLADAIFHGVPADPRLVEQLKLADVLPTWRAWFEDQEAVA